MSDIFVNSTTLPAEHVIAGRRFQMGERATGPGGTSAWVWSTLSPATVPAAPTTAPTLTATGVGSSQIDVTRTDVTGATSYDLEVSATGTGSWSVLTTAMPLTYNHTSLPGSTTRYYRARARNANPTPGPYSAVVSATTQPQGPSQSEVFSDTFTGTNGVAWDTAKWEAVVGEATFTIQNNQGEIAMPAVVPYSQYRRQVKTGTIPNDDFTVEFDWIPPVINGHDAGILFRSNDAKTFFYELRISATSSTGRTRIFKAEGAGAVEVHSYTGGSAFVAGTQYRNRVTVTGGRVQYRRWIVGQAESGDLIDWTDPGTVISGTGNRNVHITAANVTNGTARATRYDNFRIVAVSAPGGGGGSAATLLTAPTVNTDEPAVLEPLTATPGTYNNETSRATMGWAYQEPAAQVVTPPAVLGQPYEGIALSATRGEYGFANNVSTMGWEYTASGVAPGTPTGLTVTAGNTSASHSFTAPTFLGDGVTDYEIETELVTGPVPLTNPFDGATFYVNPESAAKASANAVRTSDPALAEQLDKIANSPVAIWAGDWIPLGSEAAWIDERVDRIELAGALPAFVLYNIPVRDGGGYSGGGATSAAAYRTWITNILAGLGSRRAVLFYEPDALGQMNALTAAQRSERVTLMTETIQRLADSGHHVYTDAGHSAWHPVSTWVSLLNEVRAHNGRGIVVNVSNFRLTSEVERFASDISAAYTAGTLYTVIDTSRNGNGPDPGNDPFNPPGRALGERPTSSTASARCDAYFWVKAPGESDGADGSVGEDGTLAPAAGEFWRDYAFGLAKRASYGPFLRTHKLVDTFASLDTVKWPGSFDATLSAGRIRVVPTSSYPRLSTGTTREVMKYSLVGSRASVEVPVVPSAGTGTVSAILQIEAAPGPNGPNNVEVLWQNGNLICRQLVDGAGFASDVSLTYDPVAHRWWRLRHDGSVLYWETSPDGTTWTIRRQATPTVDVSKVTVALVSGFYGAEDPATIGFAEFDNFNA